MTQFDRPSGWATIRRVLAFTVDGLAALLGGCVQDGSMDMARAAQLSIG